MNEPDDELTPELRALLRRGITPLEAPEGAASRIEGRLAATLAGGSITSVDTGGTQGQALGWTRATAAKWLAVAALGGALVGSGVTLATVRASFSPPPSVAAPLSVQPSPADAGEARTGPTVLVDAASESPSPAPAPSPPPKPMVAPDAGKPDTVAKERALLDAARAAYGRGDLSDAYRSLELHRATFSSGVLAEEREALAVRTLSGLGRSDEARARALRFEASYPESVMLPAVRSATAPRDAGKADANF